MPHDPKAIANWFLDRAGVEGRSLDPMKVQKLVYFAHGWNLGLTDEPLIDEAVEAWDYGPVVPSLYHEFKEYGSTSITKLATTLEYEGDAKFNLVTPRVSKADKHTNALLEKIWDVYGAKTGLALSAMTHVPGSPWHIAREQNPGVRSPDIQNTVMAEYFRALARK